MPKIIHYREKCIGCNSCVEHAPDFWVISKNDGKSILKKGIIKKKVHQKRIDNTDVKINKLAEKDCPVNIIKVTD